jgi:carbonic anhydrase
MAYGAVGPNAGFQFANDGHSMTLDGNWGTLRLPDGDYIAKSLNFHFPSEHAVDGVLAAGEMQIVHQKVGAKGMDDLAVVSVMLSVGDPLPEELVFWRNVGFHHENPLPKAGDERKCGGSLDLATALHGVLKLHYLRYNGSVTMPPCTEGVKWIIPDRPATVPVHVVSSFAATFGDNNRLVQRRNGRPVVDDAGNLMIYQEVIPYLGILPSTHTEGDNEAGPPASTVPETIQLSFDFEVDDISKVVNADRTGLANTTTVNGLRKGLADIGKVPIEYVTLHMTRRGDKANGVEGATGAEGASRR